MRNFQEPVITKTPDDRMSDSVETHPGYGQIGASRVNQGGDGKQLYGSDFGHNHYIMIRLYHSKLHRSLSNDHYMTDGQSFVEVSLSEAQWATMVSSLNTGFGVPCTIDAIDGEQIPGIVRKVDRREQFNTELQGRLQGVRDSLAEVGRLVGDTKLSNKAKEEILHALHVATTNMGPNLKFTADQFGEYMETTVEKAKMEVNAYAQAMVSRLAGQQNGPALTAGDPPIKMLPGTLDGEIVDAE